jgi:hypothetical protein
LKLYRTLMFLHTLFTSVIGYCRTSSGTRAHPGKAQSLAPVLIPVFDSHLSRFPMDGERHFSVTNGPENAIPYGVTWTVN